MAQLFLGNYFQAFDDNGEPLVNGVVKFFVVSTSTPQSVYSDYTLSTSIGNEVTLDGNGRATFYLSSNDYKVTLEDENGVAVTGGSTDGGFNLAVSFSSFSLGDGTIAVPSLNFGSNYGISHSPGTNELNFSADGVLAFKFDNNSDSVFYGEVALVNDKYLSGIETGGTVRKFLGVDGANVIQLGNANNAMTISSPLTVSGNTSTFSSAVDTGVTIASSGTIQSARLQLVGRQSSVNSEWNLVSAGSGLSGDEFRIVKGGWTSTPAIKISGASHNTTFNGSLVLSDAKYAYFGAGNALQIGHTGSVSLIQNNTAFPLYLSQLSNSQLIYVTARDSGGVDRTCIQVGGATPYVRELWNGLERSRTNTLGMLFSSDQNHFTNFVSNHTGAFLGNVHVRLTASLDSQCDLDFFNATSGKLGGVVADAAGGGRLRITGTNSIDFLTGNVRGSIVNGLVMGSPTGGDKGLGTINAQAVYDDNVLLTDYVFDFYLDGKINKEDKKQAKRFLKDTDVTNIYHFSDYWKKERHIPTMPTRAEFRKNPMAIGDLAQRLWETVEIQAIHISTLNDRVEKLERAA